MENMGTIFVDIDTANILASDVATNNITLVNHKYFLARLPHQVSISGTINTGTDN
jgi:hypothetical protein